MMMDNLIGQMQAFDFFGIGTIKGWLKLTSYNCIMIIRTVAVCLIRTLSGDPERGGGKRQK